MSYFPIYIDLKDKKCVVVGGGRIALRKIEILHQFGAKIIVIAPYICATIYKMESNSITLVKRDFYDSDICDVELVVAATDDKDLNSHISNICRKRDLLVNVVDVKEECSFIFPAILKKGELVISVSTGGSSPAMAHKIRKDIESVIPDYYSSLIELLGEHRDIVKSEIHSQELRKKMYNEIIEMIEINQEVMSLDTINKVIDKYKILQEGGFGPDGI